ncbi:MAG: 30S ribosomal protein S17 [Deltaproteobacteria bacterium]|nr:30S ribosomal protein S17 [Deltaproteobacteria bacterium]
MAETKRGLRKSRIGVVVSDKMDKTVVVQVTRIVMHPLYKKYIRKRSKHKAHDERGEYKIGDTVEIRESRPVSKEKRWQVIKLIERPEIK